MKSGLGMEGWMLVGVVDEARKARRRRRLFMSCGGVGGAVVVLVVVWVDLSDEEGLEAAIVWCGDWQGGYVRLFEYVCN